MVLYTTLRIQRAMSVAGPLPFPTIAGVWERRKRAGRRTGRNINRGPWLWKCS
jgi:hypothetical protein